MKCEHNGGTGLLEAFDYLVSWLDVAIIEEAQCFLNCMLLPLPEFIYSLVGHCVKKGRLTCGLKQALIVCGFKSSH